MLGASNDRIKLLKLNRRFNMSLFQNASQGAGKIPESVMYGGGVFSVCQWFADNVNWIAGLVGIVVTIGGFIWSRIDAKKKRIAEDKVRKAKREEEAQEHRIKMAILNAEFEKVKK